MKRLYKLSTGLRETMGRPEFKSDQEAWEGLRVCIPNAFATLYRMDNVPMQIINKDEYLQAFNSKYESQKKDLDNPTIMEWVTVCHGMTSDPWGL